MNILYFKYFCYNGCILLKRILFTQRRRNTSVLVSNTTVLHTEYFSLFCEVLEVYVYINLKQIIAKHCRDSVDIRPVPPRILGCSILWLEYRKQFLSMLKLRQGIWSRYHHHPMFSETQRIWWMTVKLFFHRYLFWAHTASMFLMPW